MMESYEQYKVKGHTVEDYQNSTIRTFSVGNGRGREGSEGTFQLHDYACLL